VHWPRSIGSSSSVFWFRQEAGNAAGAIAEALGVPNSSLSFHRQLRNAGLIMQERQHRSIIYRASFAAMNELVGYLMEKCCGGADCSANACESEPDQGRKRA
jgi:DNA-binding transcriptional ArsR family regulator